MNLFRAGRVKPCASFCRLIAKPFRPQCGGDRVGRTPVENEMSADLHRQRVLNFLEVFYSGDVEGALARCSDDIDFLANAPVDILPHMGHRHGKAEVRQMWTTVHARYCEMRYEVPILVAEGDKVAAHIRVLCRKSSNDRVVQIDIAAFYTLRDGRIARIREIIDTFDLVAQVLERDVAAILTATDPDKT
jgi:ketosteroid isomerase-like protein